MDATHNDPASTAPSPVAAVSPGSDQRLAGEIGAIAHQVATGTAEPVQAPPGLGEAPALESGKPFDEALTTEGVSLLIETADDLICEHFAKAAIQAGGSQADAARFSEMARLKPALKPSMVKGIVAMCRDHGWNIDPKHVFYIAVLAWARGIAMAHSGVKKLGAIVKPAEAPPNAP